ncbi:MAG TPA: TRAP transporter small permease subunit, partial [Bacteroidota bacterium]
MRFVRALNRLLVRIETIFLVTFLAVMILFAFLQVVLRNVFSTGFIWADPLVRQMVLWSGFVGAALAASQDRHISIDALTKFLTPRVKAFMAIVTNLFAAVVSYFLGRAAWDFLADERTTGSELFLGIPTWVGLLIIPIGY